VTFYAVWKRIPVAGAYRFVLTPGGDDDRRLTTELSSSPRRGPLAFAPLNVDFLFGLNDRGQL